MTSLDRFMAALRFQSVDRMPTDLHNFSICARISGLPFDQFVMNPRMMAETHIAQRNEFDHDVLLVENGTASLAQAMGCEVCLRRDDPPVVVGPAVKSLTNLDKLDNLVTSGAILDAPLISAGLETVRILRQELGDDAVVMGRGDQGPFSLASQVLGMGELLEALTDEDMEEQIECLLDICARASVVCCTAMMEAGAHCTSMGDSTAGPDMISPSMYRHFAMPYERSVVDAIHDRGGLIALHICGNATRIIEDMIDTHADILEIDQKTDLIKAWPVVNGKAAVLGQISPVSLMTQSPKEVSEETRAMLDAVGGNHATGVILGPGCALGGTTPYENIHAMLDWVKEGM